MLALSGGASALTHRTLHSFCTQANCTDGKAPYGLLEDSAGNLYGVTEEGGKYGQGVVFKLIPNADKSKYTEHVIHNFCAKANCPDGAGPLAAPIIDVDGNLYGSAELGGKANAGTLYEMTPVTGGWKYTVLHNFCNENNCSDGADPTESLSYLGQDSGQPWDMHTPLYGTTAEGGEGGGFGNGVAYEITTNQIWFWQVIHTFGTSQAPQQILPDASGNLYGTTVTGGKNGGGLMYKLAPQGNGAWTETVLHYFCAQAHCTDGNGPEGRLAEDAAGNIYGSTYLGGANCTNESGCGVVFEHPAGGGFQMIYNFCSLANCGDGDEPQGGLIADNAGNLYGTTPLGGAKGRGEVFELAPGGNESVLYSFCPGGNPCTNGSGPITPVLLDGQGNLFGTTHDGGAHGQYGTVFVLTP
ncbi:MAG TPA: choice-of-anchor tandem repeat GloVer-containing protein [Rhizomicrobium sp.]|jgi:uncharacterized repeat protein (TIGR03803 family)|nr:choice-of-anchor tandem repeat GloVer-containing protein [Rhizomicrobium sp.]